MSSQLPNHGGCRFRSAVEVVVEKSGLILHVAIQTLLQCNADKEHRLVAAKFVQDTFKNEFTKLDPESRCTHAFLPPTLTKDRGHQAFSNSSSSSSSSSNPSQSPSSSSLTFAATATSPPPQCSAHLVWPDYGQTHSICVLTSPDQLISAIDANRSLFDTIREAANHDKDDKVALHSNLIELILATIPLAYRDALPTNTFEPTITSHQVREDFAEPFRGNGVWSLIDYIRAADKHVNQDPDSYYAKTFPILQSSGTGKTKLCVQLSAFQMGMLVCVRPPHSDHSTSFPRSDETVHQFFRETLLSMNQDTAGLLSSHERIAAWIGAYFACLARILKAQMLYSTCFRIQNDKLVCCHDQVSKCWASLTYWLAVAVHGGPDFIRSYRFFPDNDSVRNRVCHLSRLSPDHDVYHDSFRSRSIFDLLPKLDNQPCDPVPSLQCTGPPTSSPEAEASSNTDMAFRKHLLDRITDLAKHNLKTADVALQKQGARLGIAEFSNPIEVPASEKAESRRYGNHAESELPHDKTSNTEQKVSKPELFARQAAAKHIQPHLHQLQDLLPSALHDQDFFFLTIDEVRDFVKLLPIFRRLWSEMKQHPAWLMFIDTDSNIAHLAGEEMIAASGRLGGDEGKVIINPYIYLPFDVLFAEKLQQGIKSQLLAGQVSFASLIDHLRYQGRPLWSTGLYSEPLTPDSETQRPHLEFVQRKLMLTRQSADDIWPSSSEPRAKNAIMAAAGHRLPLVFVGHQGARRLAFSRMGQEMELTEFYRQLSLPIEAFQQAQVSNHLRVVSEVQSNRFFTTSTPSEPPLSLAVAALLRGNSTDAIQKCKNRWSDIIVQLGKAYASTGLLLGEEGEECVRLLCSIAADLVAADRVQAANSTTKLPNSSPLLFDAQCLPINLYDWLQRLLGSTSNDEALKSWSSRFYLNFTHYVRLDKSFAPTKFKPALLVDFWWRQAAFSGVCNQCGWDLVIPTFHSPDHAPKWSDTFDPAQLSYVAIQVKNRNTDITATKLFGPSCAYTECNTADQHTDARWDVNADTDTKGSISSSIPLNHACLEIFFDLRSPSAQPLYDCYDREDELAKNSNTSRAEKTRRAGSSVRPHHCHHLTVSGTEAFVLPVIAEMGETARNYLKVLFGFDEPKLETKTRRLIRDLTCHSQIRRTKQMLQGYVFSSLLDGEPDESSSSWITRKRGVTKPPKEEEQATEVARDTESDAARPKAATSSGHTGKRKANEASKPSSKKPRTAPKGSSSTRSSRTRG